VEVWRDAEEDEYICCRVKPWFCCTFWGVMPDDNILHGTGGICTEDWEGVLDIKDNRSAITLLELLPLAHCTPITGRLNY
jgi:hypothetical protein